MAFAVSVVEQQTNKNCQQNTAKTVSAKAS